MCDKRILAAASASLAVLIAAAGRAPAAEIPVCPLRPVPVPELTCLIDGDSGIQNGTPWHLLDVDAPEIDVPNAQCRQEQALGMRALKQLQTMMAAGYTVIYRSRQDESGRQLVQIRLADGRDAASELVSRKLVQALPNSGETWCDP